MAFKGSAYPKGHHGSEGTQYFKLMLGHPNDVSFGYFVFHHNVVYWQEFCAA